MSSPWGNETGRDGQGPLELLQGYREGVLWAYVDARSRAERGLDPLKLTAADLGTLRSLLVQPPAPTSYSALAPREADESRHLLEKVLARPAVLRRGVRIYPYLERSVDEASWLLESVDIGATGVVVRTCVWATWPRDIPYDQLLDPLDPPTSPFTRSWWRGFQELSDDLGSTYVLLGSEEKWAGPERVKLADKTVVRAVQIQSWQWGPGPPPGARELRLHGDSVVVLDHPQPTPLPWPSREASLGDLSITLSLSAFPEGSRQRIPVYGGPPRPPGRPPYLARPESFGFAPRR